MPRPLPPKPPLFRTITKYAVLAAVLLGGAYGMYVANQSNDYATSTLRANCRGGGLTSFGTCG